MLLSLPLARATPCTLPQHSQALTTRPPLAMKSSTSAGLGALCLAALALLAAPGASAQRASFSASSAFSSSAPSSSASAECASFCDSVPAEQFPNVPECVDCVRVLTAAIEERIKEELKQEMKEDRKDDRKERRERRDDDNDDDDDDDDERKERLERRERLERKERKERYEEYERRDRRERVECTSAGQQRATSTPYTRSLFEVEPFSSFSPFRHASLALENVPPGGTFLNVPGGLSPMLPLK
jgi:hypothetical protein